jgi:hypothetical protein
MIFIRIAIFYFFIFSVPAAADSSDSSEIVGAWQSVTKVKGKAEPISVFSIKLHVRGPEIGGQYCYVTQYGNKADCDPSNNENISGFIKDDNEGVVTFFSFFGGRNGEAKISIRNGKLLWKVTKIPTGAFYGPMQSTLTKSNDTPVATSPLPAGGKIIQSSKAWLYQYSDDKSLTKSYLIKGDVVELNDMSSDGKFWKIEYKTTTTSIVRWIHCEDVGFCLR